MFGSKKKERNLEDLIEEREQNLKELLPDGSISPLHESKECLFCAGLDVGLREYYAITDLAHVEPKTTKRNVIGMEVDSEVGTILPVEIACCSRCKKNHQTANAIPILTMIATIILGIILLGLKPYNQWLVSVNEILPVVFFILLIPIGYFLGQLFRISYINKKSKRTIFDIFEIPMLKKMREFGWFSLFGKKDDTKLIFSRDRLQNRFYK